MGGVIDVSSTLGEGSRFTVVLPRTVPSPAIPFENPAAVAG
jgi:signal transduction histidine kinase